MKKYLIALLLLLAFTASASTITTINSSDTITSSRAVINTNFSNLNTDKFELSNVLGVAGWLISGGYLRPTTTITTLHNNGFISQASSTVSGLLTSSYSSTTALTVSGNGSSLVVSSGNVGIGTTSPYTKLAVTGTTTSEGFVATSSSYYVNNLDVTPKVKTIIVTPPYYAGSDSIDKAADFGGSSGFASTTASFMAFNIKNRITINQIVASVLYSGTGTSTLDIGIYNENGEILTQGVSSWPSYKPVDSFGTTTVTVSPSLELGPGNYYLGYLVNATSTATENGTGINPMGFVWNNGGNEDLILSGVTNKPMMFGTSTVATPGVLPNSFITSSLNWALGYQTSSSFGLFIRLDN